MAEQKTDRESILDAAEALFREKGYGNTSMADIGRATGLLKGSVYHYFPGKEALAAAILERLRDHFRATLFATAYAEDRSGDERLRAMVDAIEDYFRQSRGCLMGHLGLEVTGLVPAFAETIREFFGEWQDAFAHVLETGYDPGKARELAADRIACIEGAVMWIRIRDDLGPLERACAEVRGLLGE
jgi:AcrR family transcriptional regulator